MAMILETSRLKIMPLTVEQFGWLLEGGGRMERALCLEVSPESLDRETQTAMEGLYAEAVTHPHSYLWYTNWQIVLRSENMPAGSACFMREPDNEGVVEVGYGINTAYRGNGYMMEALIALCNWALSQPGVTMVTAGTERDNRASQRVLEKAGMAYYEEDEGCLWWRTGKK